MRNWTASSTSWMVPSVPWPVSWLTGCQQSAGSLRPDLPRQTCPVALPLDGRNDPITVARAAPASPASRTPRQIGSYGRRVTACKHVRRPILERWAPASAPVELAKSEPTSAVTKRRGSSPAWAALLIACPGPHPHVPLILFHAICPRISVVDSGYAVDPGTGMHQINHEAPINHVSRGNSPGRRCAMS
jgi:hypothetical protein